MRWRKIKPVLIQIGTVCLILGVSFAVIAYGRGYRLDVTQKSLSPTGLVAATSDPTGAQVLVDGKVVTATNNTLKLAPDWYTIRIVKEGFQPWEKRIRVQGEIVSRADAFLFPENPSLSVLSTGGVINPALSPDGAKLAFIVPDRKDATNTAEITNRAGIWVLDLVDKPLTLNRDARQLVKRDNLALTNAKLTWSPDSKQVLVTIPTAVSSYRYFLLDADKLTDFPTALTSPQLVFAEWKELKNTKELERLAPLKDELVTALSHSVSILAFSPDESKILYEATRSATIGQIITPPLIGTNATPEERSILPGSVYIYDIKEDKNYPIAKSSDILPTQTPPKGNAVRPTPTPLHLPFAPGETIATYIRWLPTSRNLLIVGKDKIDVVDYDGTNRKTVYAGPFWDSFVVPWTNASKLLILTNLNPGASSVPNLYAVNLR